MKPRIPVHLRPIVAAAAVLCLVLVALSVATASSRAATIDTLAKQAVLLDMTSNTVLFEKNAREHMPTSSMSKVMTMYMVFERLRSGRLTLEDTLPVSQRAWRTQGSKMFVELNARIKVENLVRGVIVQSGNDAATVLAEGLSGTEDAFATEMTKRAQELGMLDTNLVNANGWPDDRHYSTAYDLALLAEHMIQDFPEYYHYYSETEFTYHGIKQGNRNPLLYRGMGVDGLKTGHTEAGGYGLMVSAMRNGRRLILVANGMPSMQARADESAKLLEWGFREFESYPLFKAGEPIDQAPVWMGAMDTVPVVVAHDVQVTMNRDERKDLKVSLVLNAPVQAPVAKGTPIGKLVISAPSTGFVTKEVPVIAGDDIAKTGRLGRIAAAAKYLVTGR
ncbi:MAG: D-alanyl-D-alanine carboxypeptidase [Azospirillaceae bacterium]|nr:D-alanyl-D-alanine carboxypeptidase [Azospirillaceae bacterium]